MTDRSWKFQLDYKTERERIDLESITFLMTLQYAGKLPPPIVIERGYHVVRQEDGSYRGYKYGDVTGGEKSCDNPGGSCPLPVNSHGAPVVSSGLSPEPPKNLP